VTQINGKEIRINRSMINGITWEWTASVNIGHMAWTATGTAETKELAIEQAEQFILEIKLEGWK
jgi:hypothetical protein